ncbi:hypothetical protein B4U80_12697 [Leptotrombidium deliense]|uniref:Uncharacterized protein n=1 Tax=Leptotrombidium deliense TaxID=299467 RepID=A0A443SQF8_9ACAR|nr:hypothetical protein B4U80_12697 [Leptotrombidium deliense]
MKQCDIFLMYDESSPKISIIKQTAHSVKSSIQLLTSFTAFDENIALIDTKPNLNYLMNESSGKLSTHQLKTCTNLAIRLVSVFQALNEYPNIRVLRKNEFCRNIGVLFQKHFETTTHQEYKANVTLIIVDRSIDMLTPIVHSCKFEEFVVQELEREYNTEDATIDQLLRDVIISKVCDTLIEVSKSVQEDNKNSKQMREKQKALAKHTENVNRLSKKLKRGYVSLLTVESQILDEKKSKTEKESVIKKMLKLGHKEIEPLDVIRLLTIHAMADDPLKIRWRKLLKNKKQLNSAEKDQIVQYTQIAKQAEKLNNVSFQSLSKTPMIAKIISDFKLSSLDTEMFPVVHGNKEPRKKVFIFMVGGLSFGELQYSRFQGKVDPTVVICSDAIVTPRILFEYLFPHF